MPTSSASAMPTSGESPGATGRPDASWAVDTSVAVAFLDASHTAHEACVAALGRRRPVLAGHAAFEVFSVLTRLPGPAQVLATDARSALAGAFGDPCWLTPAQQGALFDRLATLGVRGGATYDALVGEAARVHTRTLLTRDRRATRTYDLIGVRYELIDP